MPPEPLPWDRREKKYERGTTYSDELGSGGGSFSSTPRWRDRRPLTGFHKHGSGGGGGYHQLFPDESGGHGCTSYRSEDDSLRTYPGRYGGGSGSGRSSYGRVFTQAKPMNGPDPDHICGLFSSHHPHHHRACHSDLSRGGDETTSAIADPRLTSGHSLPIYGGAAGDHGNPTRTAGTGSGCLSSSLKAVRSASHEGKFEMSLPPGLETPVRSPMASPPPSEEGYLRKKQRLGWGQGLAKYEQQKVEVPEDGGVRQFGHSAKPSLSEVTPKLMALVGSSSPATPSSVTCSSSRGLEDRPYSEAANNDATSNFSNSRGPGFQICLEGFSINSDHVKLNSLGDMSSMLADLLKSEDVSSGDSNFTRQTAINKLLLLKGDILKVLEKIESEIDLYENDLKLLNSECERSDPCQGSSELQADILLKPFEEPVNVASKGSINSLLASATASTVGEPLLNDQVKEQDVDSPETVSSRFGKAAFMEKAVSNSDTVKVGGYLPDLVANRSTVPGVDEDTQNAVSRDGNGLDLSNSSAHVNSSSSLHGKEYCSLTALIMASNRESAKKASEVFDKVLPANSPLFDVWGPNNLLSYKWKDLHIKEKLAARKGFLRFKERVLTLKFRAFQHLWKEDLRLLSIRKHRPKSQMRFELNCRSSQNLSQKHRASIRSRFALPAGNLTLVPTTEIVDFTSKLLSDSQIKLLRNNLKMPALILDERERRHSMFISNNGLVEDPCSFEKERAMINPWTQQEKEVFMEMLAKFGKEFTKISSFLSHKTTSDCIEFYYKNHKSESFVEVKKCLDLRKQWRCFSTNNYLVTSGKKWKREMIAASHDLLGAASMMAAQANGNMRVQPKFAGRSVFAGLHDFKMSRGGFTAFERANSVEILGHERETKAADILAGICGTLSSEAMSSCITTAGDPREKVNYVTVDRPLASEVTQNIDEDDTCSDEGCGEIDSVDWMDEEKSIFIKALSSYGKDFARISHCVGTKSREQCMTFFGKSRKCLGLDVIHRVPGNGGGTPMSDADGGRSDTDDACVVEMDSAICSTQSCSKMEVCLTHSAGNTCSEGFGQGGNIPLQTDPDTSDEQHEVGVSNQEGVDTKVEKLAPFLNYDDKTSARKEEGPLFEIAQGGTTYAALRSNVSAQLNETAELVPDVEETKPGNCLGSSQRLNPQDTDEPPCEDADSGFRDDFKAELEPQKILAPETGLDSRQRPKTLTDRDNISSSNGFAPEPNANGIAGQPENNVSFCPRIISAPTNRHQVQLDVLPCLRKKCQIFSRKQKDRSTSLSVNTLLPGPSSIHFEDHHQAATRPTLNFEEHKNSVHRDVYQQYLLGNQSLTTVDEPVHILRGYPLQVLNKKGMNEDADPISERSVLLHNLPKKSGNSHSSRFVVPDMQSAICRDSHQSHPGSGFPFLAKSNEQSDAQLRPSSLSSCLEMEEQSLRTGDVKLFGQILTHPAPVQKSSSPRGSDSRPSSPKPSKTFSLKTANDGADKTQRPLTRPESSGCHRGLELPLRSYGFWDGSRIQTGFSSLPESAVFLAKYPGALAGLSCYPAQDSSTGNGVLAEYQQAYLQPFSLDGKRRGIFSDLQKCNGFETVSGFQQQGRVSMSRVAGGNILVNGGGGGCTGVSDPVAAIKMHYAGMAGVLSSSEEESWRKWLAKKKG